MQGSYARMRSEGEAVEICQQIYCQCLAFVQDTVSAPSDFPESRGQCACRCLRCPGTESPCPLFLQAPKWPRSHLLPSHEGRLPVLFQTRNGKQSADLLSSNCRSLHRWVVDQPSVRAECNIDFLGGAMRPPST